MNCAGEILLVGQLSEYERRDFEELCDALLKYGEHRFEKKLVGFNQANEGLKPKPQLEEQRRQAMFYLGWLLDQVELRDSYRSIYYKNYASSQEEVSILEKFSDDDFQGFGSFLYHINAAKLSLFAAQNQRAVSA